MADDGSTRVLAPLEDSLEEGEVHVEEESEEDAAELKLATGIKPPSADQVERHRVLPISLQVMVQAMRH